MKRRVDEGEEEAPDESTPKKLRFDSSAVNGRQDDRAASPLEFTTPTKRGRGRLPGSKSKPKATPNGTIPLADSPAPATPTARNIFATPTKVRDPPVENGTPTIARNADRSARRKSARTLMERTITGGLSDDDSLDEEDVLARRIWGEGGEDEDDDAEGDMLEQDDLAGPSATPSKRLRGRPKSSRKKRTPTPPADLPPYEHYFFQNRPSGAKTSNNTLSSVSLLNHDDYFGLINTCVDPHAPELAHLERLHSRSFGQWRFEMLEGFNICLYGYGSKRGLVMKFAQWLVDKEKAEHADEDTHEPLKIVVTNGYIPTLTIRDILSTLATALLGPTHAKLGTQPPEILDSLLTHLSTTPNTKVLMLIHSLDAPPLRRTQAQTLLARLASHPSISVLATTDNPSAPLLWDSSLRGAYNFLFHDATTFASFAEAEVGDVVGSVEELLGRSGRKVGGREGVGFVLKSLTENGRGLFRILVAEQLAGLDEGGLDLEEEGEVEGRGRAPAAGRRGGEGEGAVEYRVLYQKAVEEFICSNEMNFRTLLKEFHDHQMIQSRKDAMGTELLSVPFRREELEAILEDFIG